jgi:selenobiotic family peptide radical SAM maturase
MTSSARPRREGDFPKCRAFVGEETWDRLMEEFCSRKSGSFSRFLTQMGSRFSTPAFLSDLAKLEEAFERLKKTGGPFPNGSDRIAVNPSLQLLRLSWMNLTSLWESEAQKKHPLPGNDLALLWRHPKGDDLRVKSASSEDLLALKLVADGIRPRDLAQQEGIPIDSLEGILDRAARSGLLVAPASKIGRSSDFPAGRIKDESYFTAPVFTLQWHLTQACDLHCKHCYDRSDRYSLRLHEGLEILDGFSRFSEEHHVRGQISFSGGNPLLYPRFPALYRAAKERNFNVAILGNPAPRERIEELSAIEPPLFYQVSLEGLEPHNDHIRGPGHFQRTLEFLDRLRGMGIYSMVMLTLTRDNIDQVIPLAEILRDKADLFTFNRLALVGQGANLHLPGKERYAAFLEAYTEAAHTNPVISLKDNLINIIRYRKGVEPFGGCTGYGCGAAFNFICLLPDGEVHACRKFPSYIGNALLNSLSEIYDSAAAGRYRSGCSECRGCAIRPVCGGCMAMAHSFGLNVFEEKDPFCFMAHESHWKEDMPCRPATKIAGP